MSSNKSIVKKHIEVSYFIMNLYLKDIKDEEIYVRPTKEANHLAWQLGHLTCSVGKALNAIAPNIVPELTREYIEKHTSESSKLDGPENFYTKSEYMKIFKTQEIAYFDLIESMPEADFKKDGPESMRAYAPKVEDVLMAQGTHIIMHAGQVAVLRRKLGKPIVM